MITLKIKYNLVNNNQFRCYGKKCDGQCALFQETLFQLETLLLQK